METENIKWKNGGKKDVKGGCKGLLYVTLTLGGSGGYREEKKSLCQNASQLPESLAAITHF